MNLQPLLELLTTRGHFTKTHMEETCKYSLILVIEMMKNIFLKTFISTHEFKEGLQSLQWLCQLEAIQMPFYLRRKRNSKGSQKLSNSRRKIERDKRMNEETRKHQNHLKEESTLNSKLSNCMRTLQTSLLNTSKEFKAISILTDLQPLFLDLKNLVKMLILKSSQWIQLLTLNKK